MAVLKVGNGRYFPRPRSLREPAPPHTPPLRPQQRRRGWGTKNVGISGTYFTSFASSPSSPKTILSLTNEPIPETLFRSTARLKFPPSYVVVGAYRLFTDEKLYVPVWLKCKHGVQRGFSVGMVWVALTFHLQRKFLELFMMNSPRVTGISRDTIFGIHVPFNLATYATLVLLSSQASAILSFFLSRNIRIARERVWTQTLQSRGKPPPTPAPSTSAATPSNSPANEVTWWIPYVEEWVHPPTPPRGWKGWKVGVWEWMLSGWLGRRAVKIVLSPLQLVPVAGLMITAWFKALSTGKYLHQAYYKSKGMSKDQIWTFVQERKWDYRTFGFTASLLECIPILGIVFTISNRIGAAMWAIDLEKRQHFVAEVRAKLEARGDLKKIE